MRFKRATARRSKGFLMMGLVLAVMSVCMALVYNQNTSQLHDLEATNQIMRAEQARWLVEGLLSYDVRLAVQYNWQTGTSIYSNWSPPLASWQVDYNRGQITQDPNLRFRFDTSYWNDGAGDNHDASVQLWSNPALTGRPLVYRKARRRAMAWGFGVWANLGYFDFDL